MAGDAPTPAQPDSVTKRQLSEAAQIILLLMGQVPFINLPRPTRVRATAWLSEQAQGLD